MLLCIHSEHYKCSGITGGDLPVAEGLAGAVRWLRGPRDPLSRPPAFIIVKLERTRMQRLDGLEEGKIPIEPAQQTFNIELEGGDREARANEEGCTPAPITTHQSVRVH